MLIMFADDTNLFCSNKNEDSVWQNFEEKHITERIKMTANFLLQDRDHIPFELLTLTINNIPLKQVFSSKFLGFYTDDKLNWMKRIT